MPRVETVSADTPFGERLVTGFSYPLRGAGLAACVALALAHYAGLLPMFIGSIAIALVWAATWHYAAACMLHTANGYANPPDVGIDGNNSIGWGLTVIHVLAIALCVATAVIFPHMLWPVLIMFALALPAIDMSLAFDGNIGLAINPLNWGRVIAGFGVAYLVPVAINLLLGVLIVVASMATAFLPRLLSIPLLAFTYTYLIVLTFHLMGAMIHQRHERFGLVPEAPELAKASGQDADEELLAEVNELAQDDPAAATGLLVARMQHRVAPAKLHLAYRRLLQQQNLRDGLLVHGHIWIAALMAGGDARRALGLVQECSEIDVNFLPDDPGTTSELATLAARQGMRRMALKLCRGYLTHWPRSENAPQIGLLAARQLSELGEPTEATALLSKLAAAWPEHPLQSEIRALQVQLQGHSA